MSASLGLVTIGQTPRPDLEELFRLYVPPGTAIKMVGALDDLSSIEITQLGGHPNECPLLCRLKNGDTCEVSLVALTPLIEQATHMLVKQGVQMIIVLCTGAFPAISGPVPVILPGKILPAAVQKISRTMHIGVVTSVQGQVPFARRKWEAEGFTADVTWASPFSSEETEQAITFLQLSPAEMVIMDCIGHDATYKQLFTQKTQRPILLAQTFVARIAEEFFV